MSNPIFDKDNILSLPPEKRLIEYEILYDTYAPLLLGIINKTISDDDKACEILRLSFLNFWKQIGTYPKGKIRLFTWLYQITQSTIKAYETATNLRVSNVTSYVMQNTTPVSMSANNFISPSF